MLTRLEADGFKNLLDFSLDLGPVTCLAGPNGVGKSNVLDAIQFLSLLTDHTLMEAASRVRDSDTETGDPRDIFWTDGTNRRENFQLAVEMIVPKEVRDDFGRAAVASSTFLRYELTISYEEDASRGALGRLVLEGETLDYITEGSAWKHLRFPHSAAQFRKSIVDNTRRTRAGYISTETAADGQTMIVVHQDGGSRGPGQKSPAETAPRTIVGTSNTSTTPTILAARREMQSWRIIGLEPSAMRKPDRFQTEPFVTSAGGHLAATLLRLGREAEEEGDRKEDVYAEVARRLGDLVSVSSVDVAVDEVRRLLTLQVEEASGLKLPASSLSDGTLRFLTLSILAADPTTTGLICFEEPENGIHPAKLGAMVELLDDYAVDPEEAPGSENVLRQVLIATHSPYLVRLQDKENLVFALESKIRGQRGQALRTLRCRPLSGGTWREEAGTPSVGRGAILVYLTSPPGTQLELAPAA